MCKKAQYQFTALQYVCAILIVIVNYSLVAAVFFDLGDSLYKQEHPKTTEEEMYCHVGHTCPDTLYCLHSWPAAMLSLAPSYFMAEALDRTVCDGL